MSGHNTKFWKLAFVFALFFSLIADFGSGVRAGAPLGTSAYPDMTLPSGLLHRADTFRKCQTIHWCGVRRDGRPYCGPTLRCRTCKFVRTCSRATGCVWEDRCRWGPYQPPIPQ